MNWYGIWALKKLGLAQNVYRVKLSELELQKNELPQEENAVARSRNRAAGTGLGLEQGPEPQEQSRGAAKFDSPARSPG